MGLAEQIIGAWVLGRRIERTADGREQHLDDPDWRGMLVYSPDGYMAANLSTGARPPLGAASFAGASDAQLAAVARRYVAYAGPFRVDEAAGLIHHELYLSLDPAMLETPQFRTARLVGDRLELGPHPPRGPAERQVRLEWRRP